MEDDFLTMNCYGRPTEEQKYLMLEILKTNAALSRGEFFGINGKRSFEEFWTDIAFQLNSITPSHRRSKEKWLKTWQDWKRKVKQKASKIQVYDRGTGRGPPPKGLTPLDEEVLLLIGEVTEEELNVGNSPTTPVKPASARSIKDAIPVPRTRGTRPVHSDTWSEDDIPGPSTRGTKPLRADPWAEEPASKRRKTGSSVDDIVGLQEGTTKLLMSVTVSLSSLAASMCTMNTTVSSMASAISTMASSLSAMESTMSTMADALSKIANKTKDKDIDPL